MKYQATIKIPQRVLKDLNDILAQRDMDPTGEDVQYASTAEFRNGWQADIKLVNGDPPYVDPVLFDESGNEVAAIEPGAETYDGTYIWYIGTDTYTVVVKKA